MHVKHTDEHTSTIQNTDKNPTHATSTTRQKRKHTQTQTHTHTHTYTPTHTEELLNTRHTRRSEQNTDTTTQNQQSQGSYQQDEKGATDQREEHHHSNAGFRKCRAAHRGRTDGCTGKENDGIRVETPPPNNIQHTPKRCLHRWGVVAPHTLT